jgi:hypothetical protein
VRSERRTGDPSGARSSPSAVWQALSDSRSDGFC